MNKQILQSTKASDIKRAWYIVDMKNKVLGRGASEIVAKLIGKGKSYFVKNLDCGNYVVVINSKYVVVTGKKETTKMYGNYSGYPGGLKEKQLWQIRDEKPTEMVRHAVSGMLPKNKLRDRFLTRLYIYADDTHPYKNKFINNAKEV